MRNAKKLTALVLLLALLSTLLCACAVVPAAQPQPAREDLVLIQDEPAAPADPTAAPAEPESAELAALPDEDGTYTGKEEVCAYLQRAGDVG